MLKYTSKFIAVLIYLLMVVVSTQAQVNVQLDRLVVEIWPEYDRPETLVIYRGQLAESVPLPADLTFLLPPHIETLNAVAVANDQGSLVDNPFTITPSGDFLRLNFAAPSANFQFEYYDPTILAKAGSERTLTYEAQSSYPTADWVVEVQQPPSATDVTFSPQPDNVFVGNNQLTYHVFQRNNTTPGESLVVQGSYQKATDALAVDTVVENVPSFSPPVLEAPTAQPALSISPGYWLVAVGVILLLVIAGWWFFYNRPKTAAAGPQNTPISQQGRFCYNCGTAYHSDAHFCHNCGAPRQRSKK